jgi:hypothetical protein
VRAVALHSFVDESKTPSYLLVAALIRPAHLAPIRKAITALTLPVSGGFTSARSETHGARKS